VGTSRLETFADGVFAIAATLLVLHVNADARGGGLAGALRHAWPEYAAYVLSFLVIGTWWVNHHAYVSVIDRVDRTFLFANLGFLVAVAFLPYPTQLVAAHFHDGGLRAATIVYGVTQTAAAACMWVLWSHAARGRRLIRAGTDDQTVARHSRDVGMGPLACAAATLVALWDPYAMLAVLAAAEMFYIFGGSLLERRGRVGSA
jgi:TMEM175 potassium channel family protein